ncbi:MAG: hypothetical protein GY757_59995 [bacterium]|nr:hypothetical protein [bacterium]
MDNADLFKKEYETFNIPPERIPSYEKGPDELMGRYKKCSILTYYPSINTDNTVEYSRDSSKEK